ncbi:MAG: rRNA pseudouridine synthase, partial [Planctomycetes bacterium]|nr:rRNA pseudouridine synthase [Planctomycetota bacterium]
QDGRIVKAVTGGNHLEKRYRVEINREPSEGELRALNGPFKLDGDFLLPMRVLQIAPCRLEFYLREGRKHQIRRVLKILGMEVRDLQRVAVGPLELADLPEGYWRYLLDNEVQALLEKA